MGVDEALAVALVAFLTEERRVSWAASGIVSFLEVDLFWCGRTTVPGSGPCEVHVTVSHFLPRQQLEDHFTDGRFKLQ